jgi:GDP-L-fucose synthase
VITPELLDRDAATVLLTGAHGLLGSAVAAQLAARPGLVVFAPHRTELDLLDRRQVMAYLADRRPDVVIHLAADAGGIGYNRARPASIGSNNLTMGLNVLEAARSYGVGKVIAAGSCDSYPADAPLPWREETLGDGPPEATSAAYALAKRTLVELGEAYHAQYGLTVVSLIFINMFGERDQFDPARGHVIPGTIAKIHAARAAGQGRVTVWGDGTPRRELLYAGDAARIVVHALDHVEGPARLNVGSGDVFSVKEIITEVAAQMGWDGEFVYDTSHPNGHPLKMLDTTRLRDSLGHHGFAFTPFPDALAGVIAAAAEDRR